jgi:predicted RND superfamily exporter protein
MNLGTRKYYISGNATALQEISKQVRSDVSLIGPVLFLLVLLITWVMFKSLYLTLIPLITIILTLIITFSLSSFSTITFNPITSMAPHILIAICIADTIHLISGFNSNKEKLVSATKIEILDKTIDQKIMPTLYTSITTALGFLALTFTEIKPIHDLGIVASIGTMIAWLVSYFVTPFFLLRGKKSFKKRQKSKIHFSVSYIRNIKKYRILIFTFFATVALYGVIKLPSIPVNSKTINMLVEDNPIRMSAKFIKENMGGFAGIDVLIHSEGKEFNTLLDHTQKMQSWIDKQAWATKTTSIIDFLSKANNAFSESNGLLDNSSEQNKQLLLLYNISASDGQEVKWLSTSQESARISILWVTNGSDEARKIVNEIEAYGASLGINAKVNGKTNLLKDLNIYLVDVFFRSIMLSILFVFLFMLFYLKSFKLTMIAMIPNIAPILIGVTAMSILKMEIDFASVMVASVCIGIVIDDTIHFMHSLRDSKAKNQEEKISEVLNSTGTALIHTSVILILSFFIFLFGDISLNNNFGILTIIIIATALLCDIILLPAILLSKKA